MTERDLIKGGVPEPVARRLAAIFAKVTALASVDSDRGVMAKAMCGDMVLAIAPATADLEATAEAWQQNVTLTLKTAGGAVHSWFNGTIAAKASAGDTSTAGTAAVGSADLTFVNGVATVVLSGDAAAWLADETATLTIANLTIMGYTVAGGTCVVTVVAAP